MLILIVGLVPALIVVLGSMIVVHHINVREQRDNERHEREAGRRWPDCIVSGSPNPRVPT